MTPVPDSHTLTRLRREIAFAVNADGYITWTDPATEALLGVSVGEQLATYAPRDGADRLNELISRALREPVVGWAQPLVVHGTTYLLSCSAAPDAGGAAIVATIVPDELMRMLSTADRNVLEIATLQKETDRQQRELMHRNTELLRLSR